MWPVIAGAGGLIVGLLIGFGLRRRRVHLSLDVNGDEH